MRITRRSFAALASVMAAGLAAPGGAQTPPAAPPVARATPAPAPAETADAAAARTLFEKNLAAIAHRDRSAYLACYLDAPTLARTGPEGPALGYAEFAKGAGDKWPDAFEATDLRLVPLRSGVVYGTYRYRVRYGDDEQSGISERIFLRTGAGWRIAVTTAFGALPGTPPPPRALLHATLVDGTGAPPVPDATVVIRGGKIDCAGAACEVPYGVAKSDLSGLWITPGLVDAHVHFSQTGWADGRPDSIDVRDRYPYEKVEADLAAHPERFFRAQLCSGVTSVFDVGGYPWTLAMVRAHADDPLAPRLAAAGPLLSTVDHWVNLPAERQFIYLKDEEAARAGVRYLAARGADAVKVWYLVRADLPASASAPAVLAAGAEAKKVNLPLIVHATGLAEAKVALQAGAKLLVHGVWDLPIDDEFLRLAKENGTIYCPTITVVSGYLRMNQAALTKSAPKVDDPNGCVDPLTLAKVAESARVTPLPADRGAAMEKRVADTARIGTENLKRVVAAGIPVAMGTDAGNPLTLHGPSVYAEMEAMQAAGMTPMQVVVASTAVAARAMRADKESGTIEKGKDADLLVVAGDPTKDVANLRKVRYVARRGVLRSIDDLKALVPAAASAAH